MIKRVTLADGCFFIGEFDENDVRHGRGIKFYPNGATFDGTWFNGERHGAGIKTTAGGEVKYVRYNLGVKVDETPKEKG